MNLLIRIYDSRGNEALSLRDFIKRQPIQIQADMLTNLVETLYASGVLALDDISTITGESVYDTDETF